MDKLGLRRECDFEVDGLRLLRYAIDRLQYAVSRESGA
jgi:hypothetical protein